MEYKEVKLIKENEYKKIYLIKDENNTLFIKKIYKYYEKNVYLQLKEINSMSIPRIIDVNEIDNELIVIEEYINSQTLDKYLYDNDITNNEISNIINQLCEALTLLHNSKPPIIHRDIKPENIFYDGRRLVLFDFDIAREYDENKSRDTVVMGSPGYAAPEQYGFNQSGIRSDIYSLGVLLNLLTEGSIEASNNTIYKKVVEIATRIDETQRFKSVKAFQKAFNSHSKFVSINLPGFRTNNYKHMVIAILGYLGCIIIGSNINNDLLPSSAQIYVRIVYTLFMIGSVFYFSNYNGILDKITSGRKTKLGKYCLIGFCYIMIIYAFSFYEDILKLFFN
ncbi:MAG: protein kinase [Thomasclavelia sp.]|nr:protein kinase [Thomasclavelia sp.]